jgi:predicted dinucleotide-binding enzyme
VRIGVLGTGMVGNAIGTRLVALGHQVMMGSRTATNPKAAAWAERAGPGARAGTFAEAAGFGEVVFNCTNGAKSLEALRAAGTDTLEGKIVIDVANVLPLEDRGPRSLGEQVQELLPYAKVVKTLHTVNCEVMVNPERLPGSHTVFLSGNDGDAKRVVRELLETFGWRDVIDLGDITTARATESYVALWLSLRKSLGTAAFNIGVAR